MAANPLSDPTLHFKQLQNLLKKGYTSQLIFCGQVPPSIKIPALISCKMYDEVSIQLLNSPQNFPLYTLWLVASLHMIGVPIQQYYQTLSKQQPKYKQLADDWIKINKPLHHPPQIKSLFRKKFQQLLLLSQQQNYLSNPGMPVFLISCNWLQKFYNDNLPYIPAIDNTDLYQPMNWIQCEPNCLHYNYKLKQSCRQNRDYKILPYQAWQYLYSNLGGLQFRRYTTKQKQPICQLSYTKIKILIIHQRYIIGYQILQILVSRFDTIAFIIQRIKRILISYNLIQFQLLKSIWQPIIISHLQVQQFINIIQNQDRDIIKQSINKQNNNVQYELYRLQYDHDIQDSQYNSKSDILLFNLQKNNKSFIDVHSIPYKKINKKYNKCLTCNTTQKLLQCVCKQVYFCSKQCKNKNKQHIKICANLQKQDSIINRLIQNYSVNKRKYNYQQIKFGGKVGLQNLGNTCYMNSALQCVLSVQLLNKYFCANQHIKQINATNVLGSGGDLVCAYGQLIKDYYITNRRSLQPIKILKIISSKNSQFRGYNHQDSQQFFNYFFDKLHQDLNRVRDKPYIQNIQSDGRPDNIISDLSWRNYLKRNNSFISDNFAGQYRSEIRCPDCNKISITFDPFLSVTLPFPKIQKLQQIIGYYLSQEGQYIKVCANLNANTNSQQFINKYFKQNVYPLWLRNKQPDQQWKMKKSVYYNNDSKGVLIFYNKPQNSKIQIQTKYQGFQIFHRKIFITKNIENTEQLLNYLYMNVKIPILKATKNQQLLKITNQQYLQKCKQMNFIQIIEPKQFQYPITEGILKIKSKILTKNIQKLYPILDKIKFDISSRLYQPKQKQKHNRSIQDTLTISDMISSFNQPQQLTQQNAWYCNKCKQHKLAKKIMSIYKVSQYLVIHLKRFNHKGNRYIIYGQKVKTPIKLQQQQIINQVKYQLFGVVNHYGSLSMGHYTAFVKRQGLWYYADDQSFKRRELDGKQAYLLFYKKKQ